MAGALLEKETSRFAVGPTPFKDAGLDEQGMVISPPEEEQEQEYADIITSLPSYSYRSMRLRQYQGVWLIHWTVPEVISFQRRFTARPDGGDVLLASPPKCGTTWLKALAFATLGRSAHPPSAAGHPLLRLNPHECVPTMEVAGIFSAGQEAKLEALPSPRLLHTHMHHSLLPASVAHNPGGKIVYVCREPKDMLVSLWHFSKTTIIGGGGSSSSIPFFDDEVERACEGKNAYGPFWDHFLGYWNASKACPETVMFLRYEEMLADPVGVVRELARFLGVPFTAAEEEAGSPAEIVKLCSIDTMRGLEANSKGESGGKFIKFPHQSFFRKGVAGDWRNHMTPEMASRVDAIVQDKLQGSGLTFTSSTDRLSGDRRLAV